MMASFHGAQEPTPLSGMPWLAGITPVLAPSPQDSSVLIGSNGQSPAPSCQQGSGRHGEGWVLLGHAASVSLQAGVRGLFLEPIWFRGRLTGA